MRYRLINRVYTTGVVAGFTFQPAVVDGCWVGVADVDEVPENVPPHISVEDRGEPDPAAPPDGDGEGAQTGTIDPATMTKAQLLDVAAEAGVEVSDTMTKAQIAAAIGSVTVSTEE